MAEVRLGLDASLTIDDFRDAVGLDALRGTGPDHYRTLGGMVVTELGRIPRTGEVFHAFGRRFEVVDMDRHRVDKVLVSGARAADELTADPEQGEAP